ncbi:hypothetical protein SAMN02745127_03089 [Oceanospirillum multiglobuliferum]|uniref:DUF4194 domain-containing protein n=1 Tax=Oceanospirillum multiglobuliferum TaxID=64969 RepID=A0A1T4SI80_9GAMM|nr:hypothetical protein [Oceanospirillum multiglobuliferum]OPX54116.1 hypothetical protein BTE48_15890 [Oceanospirillum multiglobuliferum]SKA27897.1 hypothetical protein SAMN02745127_03089 [Oceanospirillum multiglobuliferum]
MLQHGPLLERLLNGDFICKISNHDAYRHLSDEQTQQAINDYLRPLNRRLVSNEDRSVYFLAYHDLTLEAREHLSSQFALTVQSLLPVLEWMQLVQETLGRDSALTAGDTIKLQEFVLRTEDNQSLRHRLNALAADKFFNSQSDALDLQVKLIFRRLREHGYLLQPHNDRQYYVITGKVDYLIDIIRFIRDEEQLPVDDAPAQENLI